MPIAASLAPTQSSVQAALRAFLLNVLPGLPGGTPAVFQGTINGTTLTVSNILGDVPGTVALNSPLLGAAPGTVIVSQLSGPAGGAGTYQLSQSQTISIPTTFSTGVSVISGQANRVGEPNNPWFVVMTALSSVRLGTNFDAAADCKFTGSIAGTTLTVSAVAIGTLGQGATVNAPGVANGTSIVQQLTGTPGGAGTYALNASQNVSSETMSAGGKTMTMSQQLRVQLDFHAPDLSAGDFAQATSIAFRDEYATSFFATQNANVFPLYADDPRQVPFINAENQYEWRWSLDCMLEIVETVAVPAEYTDAISVTPFFVP